MKLKSNLLGLFAFGVLSACNHLTTVGPGPTPSPSPIPTPSPPPIPSPSPAPGLFPFSDALFANFFVSSFAPYEATASALRNSSKYIVQNITWWNPEFGANFRSDSLRSAGVEYAHAVGLTGLGQTMSIVDAGFNTAHEIFNGKTSWWLTAYPVQHPGQYDPDGGLVDDHGTHVASIAAGAGSTMTGVAPDVTLILGLFDSDASLAAANRHAVRRGAIVQNNSWGIDIDATSVNFNNVFWGSSGADWKSSINELAANTVIVFAATNNELRTRSSILPALPAFMPGIENSFITVVEAAIDTNTGYRKVISEKCFQAARWCIAADGYNYGASASNNFSYAYGHGTSYAAPVVSGAIALLAEAFPNLNAQELRARLLASADNSFYLHDGAVQFSPSVSHGYNAEFGHGMLDVKAALLPIGGSYLPRSNGQAVPVNSPIILSGGMSGDALVTRLSAEDLVIVDGLGADFETPASILTAQALERYDPIASIAGLFATNLDSEKFDPFSNSSDFSQFEAGQELDFQADDTTFTLLVPTGQQKAGTVGFSVSKDYDLQGSQLRLGLSAAREGGGFVGLKSLLENETIASTHGAANFEWTLPMAGKQAFTLAGSFGVAMPDGNLSEMSMSNAQYNSLSMTYAAHGVLGAGDRLSVGVMMPNAVQSGSSKVIIPVSLSDGTASFKTIDVSLAPEARQFDLSISYGVPLSNRSQLFVSAVRSLNAGNVTGLHTSEATIGYRLQF